MKLEIKINNSSYPVYIENGLLDKVSELLLPSSKTLLLTDDIISEKYINKILEKRDNVYCYIIKNGEKSKNIDNYLEILKVLTENEFSRNDTLIALGGGVVGDLGGFIASTYKRGLRFINLPTSLLAMVDSSIGGKTGINFLGYKNVLGSFYNPEIVLIDPLLLKTLPQRHLKNGMVEAIKCGLIKDKELFDIFEKEDKEVIFSFSKIEEIIYRSLVVKKEIVEEDQFEKGTRKLLNFGHTYGHAIEALNLDEIYHGEAVALGMIKMLDGENKLRLINVLKKLEINTEFDFVKNKDELYEKIIQDKKIKDDRITLVKVDVIGNGYLIEEKIENLR